MSQNDLSKLMQAMDLSQMLSDQAEENMGVWRAHLLELIQVLDALDRTLEDPESSQPVVPYKTVGLIRKQLRLCLAKAGLEPMECQGQLFDPHLHHAVETVLSDEMEEDVIVKEIVAGYRWQGELLRQPQVAIARPTAGSRPNVISSNSGDTHHNAQEK